MKHEKKIKIEFNEFSKDCTDAHIFEDEMEQGMLINVTVVLRAGKEPIYVKNMPDSWLDALIEKGNLLPFNPTKRGQHGP